MITYHNLSTILIFYVSHKCSQYLNWCVFESLSEELGDTVTVVTLLLGVISQELDGGRYVVPIFPSSLSELVSRRNSGQNMTQGISAGVLEGRKIGWRNQG